MKFRLKVLTLQCKKSREIIDLDHQVCFFHGKISAGKSSIVRLINFCLGGKLEMTTALSQEMVSASLILYISTHKVILERSRESKEIQVSWKEKDSDPFTVLAPINKTDKSIWNDNIFNFSDLIFHLVGLIPPKVRRSKLEEDSPLIRLSIRDVFWYCYLDQDHLDSSFFRLEDTFKRNKSRDVMKFSTGFYSQKLNSLEIDYEENVKDKAGKLSAVQELNKFLEKFGYDSTETIESEIRKIKEKIETVLKVRSELEKGYRSETHSTDDLRRKIYRGIEQIKTQETIVYDLRNRILEQKTLKSELIASKYKLAKSQQVDNILSGVNFESCPQCGENLKNRTIAEDKCNLCLSPKNKSELKTDLEPDIIRLDIDDRIKDLENSIIKHTKALLNNEKQLKYFTKEKNELDDQLQESLSTYESKMLSNFRENERDLATLRERLKAKNDVIKIPIEIENLEKSANDLDLIIKKLREKIIQEKNKLNSANKFISELENIFKSYLLEVGVPGVTKSDKIEINRKTWEVWVLPKGDENYKWNFYNAGSGGKKTLFNVCYALAVHSLCSENELPIPSILIIDTPMKNIGEDVNEDLFSKFYRLLYRLAITSLKNTQFIIVDKEYNDPQNEELDIISRYMTPDEDENPPLVSYYRGA